MKSLKELITESHKTYPWKIGIAGDLPENCESSIKQALGKFTVASLSTGKKTPITKRPLDFPQLENIDVTYFEAEVRYPTTSRIMQEYLGDYCGIPASHIIVRNPNEQQELYQEEKDDATYETILTQEDMGGESAQESAGESRVMNLLKELEVARKEKNNNSDSGYKAEPVKEEPQNNKSVVGN
jgi:hypothetical protein|tara:strand:- start:44 stop:595 length:552 start_codon:yes stop_codon:yes gene_type:complete